MYQEFFTRTIESKFIKNLLYNTPLPTYKVVRDGDYVFAGNMYIFQDNIIKIDYEEDDKHQVIVDGSGFLRCIPYDVGEKFPEADKTLAQYTVIDHYDFGGMYPQFTERFISEYGYYDSGVHEALGEYLRCLRNLYDIDLMPFYNCYSGKYASNLSIDISHRVDRFMTYK